MKTTPSYQFIAHLQYTGGYSVLFNEYYNSSYSGYGGIGGYGLHYNLGIDVITGVVFLGMSNLLGGYKLTILLGSNKNYLLLHFGAGQFYVNELVFATSISVVPQSSEASDGIRTEALFDIPIVINANNVGTFAGLYMDYDIFYLPPSPLTLMTFTDFTLFSIFLSVPTARPLAADVDSLIRKVQIEDTRQSNLNAPAILLHLYEAFFAVPMYIGAQLQQAGFYREALDWYRLVYDHTKHENVILPGYEPYGDVRKIYSGLVHEESEPSDDYLRTANWIADPFNPHTIAAMRPNAYTRFALQTIIRCLIEYADSEFAADNAESIPEARTLYLEALQWADVSELAPSPTCSEVVGWMDFSFVPDDWSGTVAELRSVLKNALAKLAPGAGVRLKSRVTSALKDSTTPQWGDRFANALAAVRSALAAAPKAPTLAALFKAEQKSRRAAQMALLTVPRWQRTDAALQSRVSNHFGKAVSDLTGIASNKLASDKTIKIDWLATPAREHLSRQDPAKRTAGNGRLETAALRAFKRRWSRNSLPPTDAVMADQDLPIASAQALARADVQSVQFVPTSSVSFCIPPNPVISELRLRGQLNLYKLRSGRNISGLQRQLEFYAAPTNAQSGLPGLSANGGLAVGTGSRLGPTEFRYSVLIDRARRQIQVAAQFESQLLQALEQADNQRENLLRARNELAVQQATLNLKNTEIQEAQTGVSLIQVQQLRNQEVQTYYQNLIQQDVSALEKTALSFLATVAVFQGVAVSLNLGAGLAAVASLQASEAIKYAADAAAGTASVFQTLSQIYTTQASYERRKQDWQQQQTLAGFDATALSIQLEQSNLNVQIRQEDANITSLQIQHAQSVVDFLVTKFTNAELFEWMSRILQGLYAGQLQQATATARLAQQQLAFDLLQSIDVIQSDYWTIPVENAAPSGSVSTAAGDTGPDRKGLTGAERLQRDTEQLDGIAEQQTKRKLQLTRTLSLATLYPGDFQRLKETGEMWFATSEKDFDLGFPGHYFRRIHKVKVSVLALSPAARGIRATLTNIGASRVTVPSTVGFDVQLLPPSNDSVSFTSPQNASGLFDLDVQPELNLPFEGVGVDTLWHFELPMPTNPMDFSSIADVQVTFEYTAQYSADYRAQLLADPVKLPRTFSAVRVFSFRNELVDQWYALHNAPPAPADLRATFSVDRTDFPGGMSNIRARRLTLYIATALDSNGNKVNLSLDDRSKQIGLAFGSDASPAIQALTSDSLAAAQSAADPWFRQLPVKTLSPFGTWTLVLQPTQAILDLLRADQIQDIIFAITYEADLPDWPTGLRPKRALF